MSEKWTQIGATVTKSQKEDVIERAKDSGMSVSEYIKARLFIDEQEEIIKASKLDKWMIKSISYLAAYIEAIAGKNLSLEEYNNLQPKVAEIIKRSGFLKDNEIFKNNINQQ